MDADRGEQTAYGTSTAPPSAEAPERGPSYFFKVEHDLMRSQAFQELSGSAIKAYLVIGMHSDFGTGWARPSIRTIAKIAGLSRQTVLDAIGELANRGMLATYKTKGRSTRYQLVKHLPEETPPPSKRTKPLKMTAPPESPTPPRPAPPARRPPEPRTVPKSLGLPSGVSHFLGGEGPEASQVLGGPLAQFLGPGGPASRPEQEPEKRTDSTSPALPRSKGVQVPGSPFVLLEDGRLEATEAELMGFLHDLGLPPRIAERILESHAWTNVASVALNAFYLRSVGKLQSPTGYVRVGVQEGYGLLPYVADKLARLQREAKTEERERSERDRQALEDFVLEREDALLAEFLVKLGEKVQERLLAVALKRLPGALVRGNPTITNKFLRNEVVKLAGGKFVRQGEQVLLESGPPHPDALAALSGEAD